MKKKNATSSPELEKKIRGDGCVWVPQKILKEADAISHILVHFTMFLDVEN